MCAERDELHRLVEELPEAEVSAAAAELRLRRAHRPVMATALVRSSLRQPYRHRGG